MTQPPPTPPSSDWGGPGVQRVRSTTLAPGTPYCGNCGYDLTGATSAAECPECGLALVDVLQRAKAGPEMLAVMGRRYTSSTRVFGLPLVSVALGPRPDLGQHMGKARGIIAVGDQAVGFVAVGGMAFGGVAIGGLSAGLATMGGMSVGIIAGLGGCATGAVSAGGLALGGVTLGGMSVGYLATGGGAAGYYAYAGKAIQAKYAIDGSGRKDPEAVAMIARAKPYFGNGVIGVSPMQQPVVALALVFATALVLLFPVGLALLARKRARTADGGTA